MLAPPANWNFVSYLFVLLLLVGSIRSGTKVEPDRGSKRFQSSST
jgi:hypothetical protein